MGSSPARCVSLLLLCAAVALPLRSEETPAGKQPAPTKTNGGDKKTVPGPMPAADARKTTDPGKMDFSSLPADAVVVICERAAEALQLIPNAVVLTPAKYQEMRDEIERLRRQLQADKPSAPTRCHLKGKVEENAVLLEADFAVVTDRPGAVVALGCPQAGGASAQIEGRTPLIRRTDAGGYFVQIDKPGEYHVKLELFVPLTPREGNARGFTLTLPRAAITTLDLDLPANARDLRVGGRPLGDMERSGLSLKNQHLAGSPALGPVEKLELTWKEVRPPSGVPVLTAEGDVRVRLDAAGMTTEADLTLRIEGAPTNVWRLLVPLRAEVRVLPPDDARVKPGIETADQKVASLRTIHLKEPSTEPLHVRVMAHGPLPKADALAPVGPFVVVGAARQTGMVLVRSQVRNLHLDYHEHGDLKLRQVTDEPGGDAPAVVAAFTYGNVPAVEKPQGLTGPASLSWLDLEAQAVRGQVRTRVTHTLTLRPVPPAGDGGLRWDVVTTIAPVAKWTEVEQLKVQVPPDWVSAEEDAPPPSPEKQPRFVVFRSSALLREGPSQPVRLEGRYAAAGKSEGRATLMLPRPPGRSVEQCEVRIECPRDCEVTLTNAEQLDLELVKRAGPNDQTWRCRHVPPEGPAIEVSWRPYRPELRVGSVVDLTLAGGRGEVRHEMRFQSPQSLPSSIGLRVPAAVGSLEVAEGGSLLAAPEGDAGGKGVVRVALAGKPGGDSRLVLRYTTSAGDESKAPQRGEGFAVPLVAPEQATGGEMRVRVWSEPGALPSPAGGPPWDERSIEEVAGRADLPVLVLYAARPDAPLRLRAGEPNPVFTVLVERALVRAQLLEGGGQVYRTEFQLRRLAGRHLDVELPGPVRTLNVEITLNHHRVTPDVVNESGQQTDGGSVARLRLSPELVRQAALLEVAYQLPPGRTAASPVRTTLLPPRLPGAPPAVPTHWLVVVASGRVLLAPESAAGTERTWERRGWLAAARFLHTAADVEREFEQSLPASLRRDGEGTVSDEQTVPVLLCWEDATGPLILTHAPRQAWLLACSLGFLVVGLGMYWSARPYPGEPGRMAGWFWPLVAVLALAAAAGVLFWPTAFWAVAYGCEPGALVLLCVVGFQWLAQQRYRRQIVFLPSFSRGRAGSSLLRKSAAHRPLPGEPSTVDAPPPS